MPSYVVLMNWTDQGVKAVKDTVSRSEQAQKLAVASGGSIKTLLWTAGRYDLVAITEAPNDEALAAILLTLGASGNLRTEVMRAFAAAEMQSILDKMP